MVDELRLRNMSEVTVRLYIGSVERYARYFGKSPLQLGSEQIREFLLHLIYDRKATASTIQLYRSALRFLYVTMLKRSWFEEDSLTSSIGRSYQLCSALKR
jgi:site-specific recombinase XerD